MIDYFNVIGISRVVLNDFGRYFFIFSLATGGLLTGERRLRNH